MIYICTALYIEAEQFIQKLNLKKDYDITKFQVFKNDSFTLLITGKGKIKASIALTYLLAQSSINSTDLIINFGFCGCVNEGYNVGQVFLCNKIIDHDTKRTYYPDIIFKHPFKENDIESFSVEVTEDTNLSANLIDMEASAIYESSTTFYEPHQIFFIKVISDHLTDTKRTKEFYNNILEKNINSIIHWITFLKDNYLYDKTILSPKDIELVNKISNNLKLSCTLKNQLKQLVKYNDIIYGNLNNELNNIAQIKCKSKKEGKIYFEKIKQKLI